MGTVNCGRCVIVAAGELEDINLIKINILPADYVIAADAGYHYCRRAGIVPNLIVGDFDSADLPETEAEVIKLNPVKDATDSETALLEAEKRGFTDILFLGATGGRLDHTFANITLVAAAKHRGVCLTVLDAQHQIFALRNETAHLKRGAYKYLSVFAFGGECTVTEKGVYYPLDRYCLSSCSALGVSNEIVKDEAEITVHTGTAIIIQSDQLRGE